MDKEDKQIIKRTTKETWRIGDRTRLKRLLENNLILYRENEELKEELENKIADIKANCDLAIEGRDIKIKELEQLNSNQAESLRITMLEEEKKGKRIEELEKENAELKRDKEDLIFVRNAKADHINELKDLLTKATDLIKNIIRVTWGEGWNYSLDWKVKAEQFLKEIEK